MQRSLGPTPPRGRQELTLHPIHHELLQEWRQPINHEFSSVRDSRLLDPHRHHQRGRPRHAEHSQHLCLQIYLSSDLRKMYTCPTLQWLNLDWAGVRIHWVLDGKEWLFWLSEESTGYWNRKPTWLFLGGWRLGRPAATQLKYRNGNLIRQISKYRKLIAKKIHS